jgi:hypothetical protein
MGYARTKTPPFTFARKSCPDQQRYLTSGPGWLARIRPRRRAGWQIDRRPCDWDRARCAPVPQTAGIRVPAALRHRYQEQTWLPWRCSRHRWRPPSVSRVSMSDNEELLIMGPSVRFAVFRLLEDPGYARRLGQNGRNRVAKYCGRQRKDARGDPGGATAYGVAKQKRGERSQGDARLGPLRAMATQWFKAAVLKPPNRKRFRVRISPTP